MMRLDRGAFREEFRRVASSPDEGVASAALCLARLEYPALEPGTYLERLDGWGRVACERVTAAASMAADNRLSALIRYMFEELGFAGDRDRYEDPANSFLNVVMDRRAGIPITLAVVLLELCSRAGIAAEGVNFPGHFLVRVLETGAGGGRRDVLVDPFHGGAIVSEPDCERLLQAHLGQEASLSPGMFSVARKPQILVRMLLNLKRSYVRMRSFPQAHEITDLLLALDPTARQELRDRGLLAYHLSDFSSALRDLQEYLRTSETPDDDEAREEQRQVWEHVKALKRRMAALN